MSQPGSLPAELAEIARLINAKQIAEADRLLAVIEADPAHPAWEKSLVVILLRDRINKGGAVWL